MNDTSSQAPSVFDVDADDSDTAEMVVETDEQELGASILHSSFSSTHA